MKTLKCIHHASRPAVTRGICRSCYNSASRLVRHGQTQWLELEAKGIVLPVAKRGPKLPEWARAL